MMVHVWMTKNAGSRAFIVRLVMAIFKYDNFKNTVYLIFFYWHSVRARELNLPYGLKASVKSSLCANFRSRVLVANRCGWSRGWQSKSSLSFCRGSRVEGRGRVIFITKRRFLFWRYFFILCRSVQFGLNVPPRFDLMSVIRFRNKDLNSRIGDQAFKIVK